MKCYIASPWFDKDGFGFKEIEEIKKVLDELYISYFSPKDMNLCLPDASEEEKEECFQKNLDEISKCDFMIANTRDKDIGTCIELGYAKALKKSIILYCPQIKHLTPNLMLVGILRGVSFEIEELKNRINEFMTNIPSPKWEVKIE
jgi:nucleoside 2-deoxyribosyltransferase